jgi:hypothetical protein
MSAEPPTVTPLRSNRTPSNAGSAGSIVLGWLTKLVVGLSLMGVLAFDGIALVQAHFNAADHANTAAKTAASTYKSTKNPQAAAVTAANLAAENGETVSDVVVAQDGVVSLTLHKTVTKTLWMHRIGFLKKYTEISSEAKGKAPL